jgi:hypothetical protein
VTGVQTCALPIWKDICPFSNPKAEVTKQNMDHSRSKLSSKFESSGIRYSDIFSDMRNEAFLLTLLQNSSRIIMVSP